MAALRGLTDWRLPDPVLYTAAVVVLLERDFVSCQTLWDLMHDKALAYVQNYGNKTFDMAKVAEKLEGLGVRPSSTAMISHGVTGWPELYWGLNSRLGALRAIILIVSH